MYGYIYLTTDTLTNKIYVGQKKSNKFLGTKYLGSGTLLSKIIALSKDSKRFTVQLIDTADSQEELDLKEIFWIEQKDARNPSIGYNLAIGGSTNAGFTQTDIQKQIVSEYMKNRIITDSTRKKMSASAMSRTDNRVTNNEQLWVTDGESETMVSKEHVQKYLDQGFKFGRLPKSDEDKQKLKEKYASSEYIIKDGECMNVPKNTLQQYLEEGWVVGRNCYSAERNKNVSKGKRGTIKIVHVDTGKVKYINPTLLDNFTKQGYVTNKEYLKITQ